MLTDDQIEQLKQQVKDEFSDYYEHAGGKNYRYHHSLRVLRLVNRIMQQPEIEKLDFDTKVVQVAALFHDIGRAEDIEDGYLDPFETHEGHASRSADYIRKHLNPLLTQKQVQRVSQAIAHHHGDPSTVEGKILQDSDALDVYGVQNLWRMIHYAADQERTFQESLDYFWNEAVPHFEDNLPTFHFRCTRKTAEQRLEKHKQVIREMEHEWNADDIKV
jgi:putative nucleotidyltransferase with HDIG domain